MEMKFLGKIQNKTRRGTKDQLKNKPIKEKPTDTYFKVLRLREQYARR